MGIENIINKSKNFIKNSYKEEWPTMINHLISVGVSVGSGTAFSHYSSKFIESDATISSLATVVDVGSYWTSLMGQFLYRDRKTYKDKDGNINKKQIRKDIKGYLLTAGTLEVVYVMARTYGQYFLQKKGFDPGTAAFAVQTAYATAFTGFWPLMKYGLRKINEK